MKRKAKSRNISEGWRLRRLVLLCLVSSLMAVGCGAGAGPEAGIGMKIGVEPKADAAVEGGAGAEAGVGAEGGAGAEAGVGTEGGAGAEAGVGTEGGAGAGPEAGIGTEIGAEPEPGASTESSAGAETGAAGGEAVLPVGWTPTLTAVVTSDLHFDLEARFSVYPLMAHIPEIAEIMADQVIALHPDVFIMTGDNTNSGMEEDVAALTEILGRIRDAGIEVIVTTGNHDFDKGHIWEPYQAFFTPVLRDEATESSAVDMKGYRFLVMDDNSEVNQVGGTFPASTLVWMEEAMDTENEVIFLSHHNVLPGGEESAGSTYTIQVPSLRDILADGGVRLCLSGHRHTQEILQYKEMYEIISSPLAASPHQYGVLELGGGCCRYRTEVLDLGMELLTEEVEAGAARTEAIAGSADFSGRRAFRKDKILALFGTFMDCVARGTLAEHRDEIAGDECYGDMLAAFEETNYGPWIRARMEEESLPGNYLVIGEEDLRG